VGAILIKFRSPTPALYSERFSGYHPSMKKKRFIARTVLTLLITAAFVGWMWLKPAQNPSLEAKNGEEVAIGGTFSLVDSHGNPFSSEALKGKYSLVFFGFTQCPELCPTALSTITLAMEKLGDAAAQVTPVFITVDPARDTPEVMAEYATHFHPSLVALTGSEEEIHRAEEAYKVFASKHETDEAAGGYTMDHSGYMYLMDRQGRYVTHFSYDVSPDDLAAALGRSLEEKN